MHEKRYRDSYVASHTRRTLAQQIRKLRGDDSQASFAEKLGKRQTVVSRLENPGYSGWSLKTMFEVAQALDIAVFVRFVDFPTFLRYSNDLSESALRPASYAEEKIDEMARQEERAERDSALKALFSQEKKQTTTSSAKDAAEMIPRSAEFTLSASKPSTPANDSIGLLERKLAS